MAEQTATSGEATGQTCSFVRSDGSRCPGAVVNGELGLCFWHDPDSPKEEGNVRERLEEWAESGQSMEGFSLRYAALEGLKLSDKRNRDLRGANLFRASLQGASLYNVDLSGAELLKANLAGANLNEAVLQDAELLASVWRVRGLIGPNGASTAPTSGGRWNPSDKEIAPRQWLSTRRQRRYTAPCGESTRHELRPTRQGCSSPKK